MVRMSLTGIRKCLMSIDLETATRTLVIVSMAQSPGQQVSANLTVALLSGKFPDIPETEITRLVTSTIVEEGGSLHQQPVSEKAPADVPEPMGAVPRSSVRLR